MDSIHLKEYEIFIGGFGEKAQQFLKQRNYTKIAVILDENTRRHCLPIFTQQLNSSDFTVIEIASGERHKNIETCQRIWHQMMQAGLDRRSLTINLGGGVIGDMGGFCATTFKRGMDFIQLPTTLLSQVDASIGGKLGIDFNHIKNSIGIFRNPQSVFIEPLFLKTLPEREIRSGFAEIIKHSLIADAGQWEVLQQIEDLGQVNWEAFLLPSLEIKKKIVAEDPFEKGIRKALNFGHTIGHAIESFALAGQRPLLHGEAISIGMICEAWLSHKIGGLPFQEVAKIAQFILQIYGTYPLNKNDYPGLIELMTKDKKNENERINFTLINPVGQALINQTCDESLIHNSLQFYNQLVLGKEHKKDENPSFSKKV